MSAKGHAQLNGETIFQHAGRKYRIWIDEGGAHAVEVDTPSAADLVQTQMRCYAALEAWRRG